MALNLNFYLLCDCEQNVSLFYLNGLVRTVVFLDFMLLVASN